MMEQRIKVLMFGWEFPPFNSGGLGVACYGLSRALLEQGVDIVFVLPKKFDINFNLFKIIFASDVAVKFHYIDSALYAYVTSEEYKSKSFRLKNGLYGQSLLDEVKRYALAARGIAESEDFDVIHAHDWLSFLAGIEAKKISHKPLITHIHATEFDRTGGASVNQDVYDIEKHGMSKANKIIAVSNFTKNIITDHYDITPNKVEVIHNGVEALSGDGIAADLEKLKDKYKIVLFVGRLTLQKGPDYFIRAARRVLDHDPNILFVMSGAGDMKNKLIQEAIALGISDKVVFTGFLRDDSLKRIYKAADLFVMPSVSEPFGITALESLANGTPVIISKQSGASEVISHGLKVDFWDTDEMAAKILAILKYGSLHETLKKNGKNEVKKINWEESAKKVKKVYREVLNSKQ